MPSGRRVRPSTTTVLIGYEPSRQIDANRIIAASQYEEGRIAHLLRNTRYRVGEERSQIHLRPRGDAELDCKRSENESSGGDIVPNGAVSNETLQHAVRRRAVQCERFGELRQGDPAGVSSCNFLQQLERAIHGLCSRALGTRCWNSGHVAMIVDEMEG